MRPVRRFWRRLRETLRPWRRDGEFTEEVETHIGMLTQDNVRAGMSQNEARRAALLTFGSVDAAVEGWRDQRRLPLLDTLARDVRFALRGLRRDPGSLASALSRSPSRSAPTRRFSVL
jgi:macrolide transport system ATP-binding/permease protein